MSTELKSTIALYSSDIKVCGKTQTTSANISVQLCDMLPEPLKIHFSHFFFFLYIINPLFVCLFCFVDFPNHFGNEKAGKTQVRVKGDPMTQSPVPQLCVPMAPHAPLTPMPIITLILITKMAIIHMIQHHLANSVIAIFITFVYVYLCICVDR